MTRPLVTAVMPAYNAEAFVEQALESILAQDYDAFEVIVVDDGSTDGTPEIVRRFGSLQVIRQENQGPAAARNTAIRAGRGEFVACCDADDLWPPHRFSAQVEYLVEHPGVGCLMGRQEWQNPPPWFGRDAVHGDLDGIPLNSAMFRRAALDRLGAFDESFVHGEDMDLLIRMREHGIEVAVLPEVIVHRRYHGSQLTANAPDVNPLLRSMRGRLARARAAGAGTGASS
jgi:glycosyltransferase involved in cell wall biosynthesis